jgi:hypothetical protein
MYSMGFALKIGFLIYLLTFLISLMVVGIIILIRKASRLGTKEKLN